MCKHETYHKKVIIFTLILLVVLCVIFRHQIFGFLMEKITVYQREQKAFPQEGVYKCEEQDLTITFIGVDSEREVTLSDGNGKTEICHFSYDGGIDGGTDGESFHLIGAYFGNQDTDTFTIKAVRGNLWNLQEGETYVFNRQK